MTAKLTKVTDGVHVGALFPLSMFNTVVIEGADGDVLVDAGFPWSGRRLARFIRDRNLIEHVVTHAHGDHVGSSAWLCEHAGVPLGMSEIEATDFESGSIAYHAGAGGKYWIAPLGHRRRQVDRRLKQGDVVAGFEVLLVPGHSPGLLAFWREADRTLIVGDGPINLSKDEHNPRWLRLPKELHNDPEAAVIARKKLTELRPDLIVSTHGYPVRSLDKWIDGVQTVAH